MILLGHGVVYLYQRRIKGEYKMNKTYYKQLYRDITENFYHRFDDFITVRWSGQHIAGIREEERKAAYR